MRLVLGHSFPILGKDGRRVRTIVGEFPHLCPGEGCAISAYLYWRDVLCPAADRPEDQP